MPFQSPFTPTTDDVNVILDRFLPGCYARPHVYNALLALAQQLHAEASDSSTALKLTLLPDTSKWTVEGRVRDADFLDGLIQQNKAHLKLTIRRRLYAVKRQFLYESKLMRRAMSSTSTLSSSAMDKRRQAQALTELLSHMKSRPFVYNYVFLTAAQLEREAQLLEQITSRTTTNNTRLVAPLSSISDKQHYHGRYVTNPPATLEERKKDIAYLEELLFSLSQQEEDQASWSSGWMQYI
jgi:hypothetical protein